MSKIVNDNEYKKKFNYFAHETSLLNNWLKNNERMIMKINTIYDEYGDKYTNYVSCPPFDEEEIRKAIITEMAKMPKSKIFSDKYGEVEDNEGIPKTEYEIIDEIADKILKKLKCETVIAPEPDISLDVLNGKTVFEDKNRGIEISVDINEAHEMMRKQWGSKKAGKTSHVRF